MDTIAQRIRERPWRSLGVALLAGAWLGYEPPRRSIMLGLVRMFVMNEVRAFVDGLPPHLGAALRTQATAHGVQLHDRAEPSIVVPS